MVLKRGTTDGIYANKGIGSYAAADAGVGYVVDLLLPLTI
jgi:hypothetical protein